jgi:phosphoglycolate phosphatase
MKHLIFDWSGTVVDDLPPVIEATNAVLKYAGRPTMDRETFRRRFRLPYTEFYAEETPHVPMAELEREFRAAFASSTAPVTLLPGARQFLEQMQQEQRRMFVLSSAPAEAVVAQAKNLGIDHFFESFHAGIIDKRAYIATLMEQHGLTATELLYVGDMVHDIETARHVGIFSVGVLTGYDYPEVLSKAKPDLLLEDLPALGAWLLSGLHPAKGLYVRD